MASRSARDVEPFPPLLSDESRSEAQSNQGRSESDNKTRGRRKSSGLRAELPGDTNVPAFATLGSPPATPTEPSRDKSGRRSKRRSVRRALSKYKRICKRHTWVGPLTLLVILLSLYLINPTEKNPLAAAIFLSYPLPREPGSDPTAPIHYGKGGRDFAFVAFYTIVFSFTREFLMQRLIRPIAIYCGIKSRAKQSRFMEQFYTAMYFAVYGPFGLYVMSRTPVWYFNTTAMYEGFPHKTHEALFKAYYLLQASYWAQQMIVLLLGLEKPRKDYKEYVAHHVITLTLIWCSYRFHFTYMGLAIYITMDVSDFFLATSKVLNYLDSPITGPYFFVFMCAWGYLRHWVNLRVLYSILTEFKTVGPYELNWETQQYKCWISQIITFGLLAALQAVNLFWWFLICRIAYRFIRYQAADDDRSEYEESDNEETSEKKKSAKKGASVKANGNPAAANGTPKVLVNGEPITSTAQSTSASDAGSIASRLRERKKGQN